MLRLLSGDYIQDRSKGEGGSLWYVQFIATLQNDTLNCHLILKNADYELERGATRNFEAWKEKVSLHLTSTTNSPSACGEGFSTTPFATTNVYSGHPRVIPLLSDDSELMNTIGCR